MSLDNFDATLTTLLERRPFGIFTIALKTGRRFEVDGPRTVVHRDGMAIYLAPGKIPIYFDHDSVSDIMAAPANTDLNATTG